jgi:hypothetical protein
MLQGKGGLYRIEEMMYKTGRITRMGGERLFKLS